MIPTFEQTSFRELVKFYICEKGKWNLTDIDGCKIELPLTNRC